MQRVTAFYEEISDFIPRRGHLYLSDYVALHRTFRIEGAGPRISIDSTVLVGDHEVLPDRRPEYGPLPLRVGVDGVMFTSRSETDEIPEKSTAYSHYTSGSLRWRSFSIADQ